MIAPFLRSILFLTLGLIIAFGYPYSIFHGHNFFFGFLILSYFLSQILLAILNHRQQMYHVANAVSTPSVSLLVIGYRENPDYWEKCLRSILQSDYPNITALAAFVDGDDQDDHYMASLFRRVLYEYDDLSFPADIVLCPHRGKRHAMEAGFRHLRDSFPSTEYVIVIDSDTVLEPPSIRNLVACIHSDPRNGCATGNIRIFNTNTILARIVAARYAYAFTIERSAMSAMGVMNCCSGPFSIYRQALLDDTFLDDFIEQQCCGKQVGPGDDRHATLLILARGHLSRQSHLAVVSTETPETLHRYFQQQLRWMRSFYREQPWQIRSIPRQNIYLAFVTIYELLFPFFILLSFLPTFQMLPTSLVPHQSSVHMLLLAHRAAIAVAVLLVRTLLLCCFDGFRLANLWNLLVFPMYFLFLLPLKLSGLLTCGIQGWITSDRKTPLSSLLHPDIIIIYLAISSWISLLTYLFWHLVSSSFFS